MSLRDKPYYFLTDRTTLFHYLVDNRTGTPQKHIFYPSMYETMKASEIAKFEHKLVRKFLRWGILNKDKMDENDWKVCKSIVIDLTFGILGGMLMARLFRTALFRHEFVFLETLMEKKNYDVKFWKAIIAYTTVGTITYKTFNNFVNQTHLLDLALEYHPNFLKGELLMPELEPMMSQIFQARFSQ